MASWEAKHRIEFELGVWWNSWQVGSSMSTSD